MDLQHMSIIIASIKEVTNTPPPPSHNPLVYKYNTRNKELSGSFLQRSVVCVNPGCIFPNRRLRIKSYLGLLDEAFKLVHETFYPNLWRTDIKKKKWIYA